jgi:SAM-dependent methyltransferase
MAVSRATALRVRNFLDNWLPPRIRDSRWLMYPLLRLALGPTWREFAQFKAVGFSLTAEEFAGTYRRVAGSEAQGATDLNDPCVEAILAAVPGGTVLEAGCGRGYLAQRLTEVADKVTACDIVLDEALPTHDRISYEQASVETLPYPDSSFDTVVCTHTLEHVQRIDLALSELRRVARHQVVIVVPRERPYKFSFNLHLHFFPHPWSWQAVAGSVPGATLRDLGDWFYVEPQGPND